jgi:predicted adenylyl cyclase CyaB
MNQYEVEIKSLLGQKENAERLIETLKSDPTFESHGSHKQLNHYFVDGNLQNLFENCKGLVEVSKKETFEKISINAKEVSVRSRWADGKVILVIKASIDDTTSSNGTARMEFESQINISLEELDKLIEKSGFKYQAKWSRERQEYKYKDMNVSIDKNAGYGYLAEFERVVEDPGLVEQVKNEIRKFMGDIGVAELPQDRLARMFDFYNNNWQDYYGTEKVFNVE